MQIVKDQHIIDNTWQPVEDESNLPVGEVVVSLSRWLQEKHQLLHRNAPVAVRLQPNDDVLTLADDVNRLPLIEINFPDFADGRGFSQAWLLRERLHFTGELRAVGAYMPDQVFYLSRVGFNAFIPERFEDLPILLAKLHDFSVKYQLSVQ